MKNVLLMIVASIAVANFASAGTVGPNSSWEEIKNASNYSVTFPQIGFYNSLISVDGLCIDGDNLRPFQPNREVCVEWKYVHDRDICVRTEVVYFSTPISYTEKVCTKWSNRPETQTCLEYKNVPAQHELNPMVEVYKVKHPQELRFAFKKEFNIPACN